MIMENVAITKQSDVSFTINGIDTLSARHLMKFNIYLNSLPDASINRNGSTVSIVFSTADPFVTGKCINSLADHFGKQGISCDLDEGTSELLHSKAEHEETTKETYAKLKGIQSDSLENNEEYSAFCAFCDSKLKLESLRPYQYTSAFLLSTGKGGFDFSVPGAGKTIITYTAYAYLKERNEIDSIFVVGPASSYNAWFDEYYTCFGTDPDFENLAEETTNECKLYLTASAKNHREISFINIEKIRLLVKEITTFFSAHKTILIIDEAHKIKNPNAKATIAALELAKKAAGRILLTGTPMPNGYEDLYSLSKVFAPYDDILPYNYSQLCSMTKNDASEQQAEKIRSAIGPYYSRISKKYLLSTGDLLPSDSQIINCTMDDDQRELYDKLNAFCGKLSDDIDEDILMALKKAVLIRKMQISADPALLRKSLINSMDELRDEYASAPDTKSNAIDFLIRADRDVMDVLSSSEITKIINSYVRGASVSAKNKKAVEIAEDLISRGEKVLIWDIFVKNMDTLKALLDSSLDTQVEIVNGSVHGAERQDAIERFRKGKSMVLLANPATLAESISLHKVCQNAIYVNRNFNAAQFIQSKDRIHRINMPKGTTAHYYFLMNDDSVDVCVDEKLTKKEERMLAILDSDEVVIGGAEMEDGDIMSSQDIEDSFKR